MARKTQTQEVRVYSYDSNGPIQNLELLTTQAKAGHRYYNDLVRIEKDRREVFDAMRLRHCPELQSVEAETDAINTQIEQALAAIGKDKSEKRTRNIDNELAAKLKELKIQRKPIYSRARELRAEFKAMFEPARAEFKRLKSEVIGGATKDVHLAARANEEVTAQMLADPQWHAAWKESAIADREAAAKVRAARASSVALKGTYDLIDAAFTASKNASAAPPNFKRWDGSARVGRRISESVEDVVGGTGSISIAKLPESTWDTRSGRRHANTTVRVILGSGEQPVIVPFMMDRPLPAGGIVRNFWITMRSVGSRTMTKVQFTVEGGKPWLSPSRRRENTDREKAVAINFGWRKTAKGLRVAYWRGTDGRTGEILVSSVAPLASASKARAPRYSLMQRLDQPDALRAVQDTHWQIAMGALIEAKAVLPLPVWSNHEGDDQLQYSHLWKSSAKLAGYVRHLARTIGEERVRGLWQAWRVERLASHLDLMAKPDEISNWANGHGAKGLEAFAFRMWVWLEKDQHLYQWASHARDNALRARREVFRIAARRLEQCYETLVIDDSNFAEMAKRVGIEEQTKQEEAQRKQRKDAAPGELRSCLELAFGGPKSTRIDRVTSAGNSADHHVCGNKTEKPEHCERCGVSFDSDDNNCRNQLKKSQGEGPRDVSVDGDLARLG